MSLAGYWNDLKGGALWGGPGFGNSDAIAASDASINSQEAQINQSNLDAGLITQATYDQSQADLATQADDSVAGQNAQLNTALKEGWNDGLNNEKNLLTNVTKGGTNVLWQLILGILKGIPWWVWLGLALWIFIELGGGGFVTRRARERLAR